MSWIQTFSGLQFSLTSPEPQQVCLQDVVQSLGNLCRFNGHCRHFYSVLQHSVQVAMICPPEFRYTGLMHDAAEAYYGDITRPQKIVCRDLTRRQTPDGEMSPFDLFVERIDRAVAAALGVPYPLPDEVQYADDVMLATEARDLMEPPPEPWPPLPPPLATKIRIWNAQETYTRFAVLYNSYSPRLWNI